MSRRWRQRLRQLPLLLVVVLAIGSVTLFAWLTREPEHPLFEELSGLPVLGPLVAEIRRPWLRAARSQEQRERPTEADRTDVETVEPPGRDFQWIGIGARVWADRSRSRVLTQTTRLAGYDVLERDGSWLRVELPDGREGWVDRSEARDPRPPLGSDPEPPKPLPGREAEPERLRLALEILGEDRHRAELDGYTLWTDVPEGARLLADLERAVAGLEELYQELYGVAPVGEARETVVLFEDGGDYRTLQRQVEGLEGIFRGVGHTGGGLVALAARGASWEVEATLVHEIGHLLNRRALGPSLPGWLSEGLADHLSHLGRGRTELDPRFQESGAGTLLLRGPRASLSMLVERADRGALPSVRELVETDPDLFIRGGEAALRYAQSAYLIEFLLQEPALRERFLAFLDGVSRGEPVDAAALRQHLGRSWALLDAHFQEWLRARELRARTG